MTSLQERVRALPWPELRISLSERGYALTPAILSPEECRGLIGLYAESSHFRSHIDMTRYRFGRGDYKYFRYPLPAEVQALRASFYPELAALANEWNLRMGSENRYPDRLEPYLASCHALGQRRPTPLLLHYEAGDYNCLHQDLYGEESFPLQVTLFLSRRGNEYEGGESVLVEQQPRAQSKASVIAAGQGQALIFATRYRPVRGSRGVYRVNLRHGVSEVLSGRRYTLGIIFHDAE